MGAAPGSGSGGTALPGSEASGATALEGVGNEQGLIGVEAFGAWAVDSPQEEVEAVLQLVVLASRVAERGEQFEDHLPEDGGIVGQRRRGIGEGLGGGGAGVFAHALLDV